MKTSRLERVKKLAVADSVPLFEDVAFSLHGLCWQPFGSLAHDPIALLTSMRGSFEVYDAPRTERRFVKLLQRMKLAD